MAFFTAPEYTNEGAEINRTTSRNILTEPVKTTKGKNQSETFIYHVGTNKGLLDLICLRQKILINQN